MAVYCRPRTEKKVAERLEARGVEVYCPLQTTLRQWSDRKKKVKVPVFPSYVFVHVAEVERLTVLQDPGVMNFVYWLGKPAVIRDGEIKAVRAFLEGHPNREFEVCTFEQGQAVRIGAGPFYGYEATVEDQAKDQVTVVLEGLGLMLRIKIPVSNLERADRRH